MRDIRSAARTAAAALVLLGLAPYGAAAGAPREFHVYLYSRTLDGCKGRFSELAHDLSSLGFTDAYLSLSVSRLRSDPSYPSGVRRFNESCHARGIRVHALLLQGKNPYLDKEKSEKDIGCVLSFNASSPRNGKFDGITFDLEPHVLKEKYGVPADFPAWDQSDGYGIRGPNDKLVQLTLHILEGAGRQIKPAGLVTSEAIGHFFHDRTKNRDLSSGDVNDFLKFVDFVILMDYSDDVRLLKKFAREEIVAARRPRSVVICLKTRSNPLPGRDGRGPETTFHEEGWEALQRAISELEKEFRRFPAFRAIGIFEYESYRAMAGMSSRRMGETVKGRF